MLDLADGSLAGDRGANEIDARPSRIWLAGLVGRSHVGGSCKCLDFVRPGHAWDLCSVTGRCRTSDGRADTSANTSSPMVGNGVGFHLTTTLVVVYKPAAGL